MNEYRCYRCGTEADYTPTLCVECALNTTGQEL